MAKIMPNLSQAEAKTRKEILGLLKIALDKVPVRLVDIDYPPTPAMGDFSLPCFLLAKKFKKSPVDLARELSEKMKPSGLIKEIRAAGPYLNFFVDQTVFSLLVLKQILKKKDKYGAGKAGHGKKVMVEYFSPNTTKPLTVGHLRNIFLGWSVSQLLRFLDYKVIEATLYNDRGIAMAKTIAGYQKWGDNKTPQDLKLKPDHFVGSFYVRFCQEEKLNPDLSKEAQRVLQDWEKGKKEIKEIWQKLTAWVLEGFEQTLKDIGPINFEERYYESEFYNKGKEIIEDGLKKGVFIKDKDGVLLAPLQKYGLPDKVLLRPDETSLYITQDLYLAYLKNNKYNPDYSINVVGSEQELYFKQLFKILELLEFEKIKNYRHLSYGMVRLPSGRIKSREGLVKGTGADELIAELRDLAGQEMVSRSPELEAKDAERRAQAVALGALKFFLLSVSPQTTMIFDPQKSLAFIGRTGPYLQYVYARISSIFAKEKVKVSARVDFAKLSEPEEFDLVKRLSLFPKIIDRSARDADPSHLANYLYELAQSFSLFYEKLPVLKADKAVKKARLLLLEDVRIVLERGLSLLGITAPEKM